MTEQRLYQYVILLLCLAFAAIVCWFYGIEGNNLLHNIRSKSASLINNPPKIQTAPTINMAKELIEKTKSIIEIQPAPQLEVQAQVQNAVRNIAQPVVEQSAPKRVQKVIIRRGDTLSTLFDKYKLGQSTLHYLLAADESLLALETLHPGQKLIFHYKGNSQYLEEMEFYPNPGQRVQYRRIAKDAFNYESSTPNSEWRNERVSGTIKGPVYFSAVRAGLTKTEAAALTQIFREQMDFSQTSQKGDQFQIVRSRQYVNAKPTGQTRIESAYIHLATKEYTAFLFEDGRYYDRYGKSLDRAFRRTPLNTGHKITSHFNPRRVHPITGVIGPHNGTDFAVPTGTQVVATGDGHVTRVRQHPFAGNYIEIQHGGRYTTRYLHLEQAIVKKGDWVTRGQTIALSGNSGRSTGPHVHYELHINGKAVDPIKAKIPTARPIPFKSQQAFATKVAEQTQLLGLEQTLTEVAINQQ